MFDTSRIPRTAKWDGTLTRFVRSCELVHNVIGDARYVEPMKSDLVREQATKAAHEAGIVLAAMAVRTTLTKAA